MCFQGVGAAQVNPAGAFVPPLTVEVTPALGLAQVAEVVSGAAVVVQVVVLVSRIVLVIVYTN